MNRYTLPDPVHSVLLTIDVQREFLGEGSTGRDEKLEVIPSIKGITGLFRSRGLPIIHVVRIYLKDGSNADICRRYDIEEGLALLRPSSDEVQIVRDILPDPDIILDEKTLLRGDIQTIGPREFILYKPRFGAFYRTPLEMFIREKLALDSLVICGFNFPNCPRATIYEASERDLRIIALEDGISHIYHRGRKELEDIHVQFLSLKEMEKRINKGLTA